MTVYAKLERRNGYAVVANIIDIDKDLPEPRYMNVTDISPQPKIGWYFRNGMFYSSPSSALARQALRDIVRILEDAGLVDK